MGKIGHFHMLCLFDCTNRLCYFQVQGVIFFSENTWLSKKYSFWPLMLCGEFANIIKKKKKKNVIHFLFFIYKKSWSK